MNDEDVNRYTLTKNFHKCYRFNVETLNRIELAIARYCNEIEIKVFLDDGTTIGAHRFSLILSETIFEVKIIKKIEIHGIPGENHPISSIFLYMHEEFAAATLRLSISGSKESVNSLSSELENLISSSACWYSFLNSKKNAAYFFFEIALSFTSASIMAALVVAVLFLILDKKVDANNFYIGTIYVSIMLTIFLSIAVIRRFLFPRLVFPIGVGESREKIRTMFRKFVFGTVLFGGVFSIVLRFFGDWLRSF